MCFVYRSNKKDEMYLYLPKRDEFSEVPEPLMKAFGEPQFALQVNLGKRDKLAREDIETVKQKIQEQGFFLQMPPSIHPDTAQANGN